jgi:hypothetical protein
LCKNVWGFVSGHFFMRIVTRPNLLDFIRAKHAFSTVALNVN